MTRSHAAIQLLRLGPLSFSDFRAITGWPRNVVRWVISDLLEREQIEFIGNRHTGVYRVKEAVHA